MEDAGRSQPGLGLRRLRNLCADHLGRRRLAPAPRSGELLPDPALSGAGDRPHPARLGDRRHDRGVVADYIGRKRAMILAILAYSILTGLSAFAWDWLSFAVLRFLVGLAIGSEWVTGTSIVSELWPDKNRGKGVGLMQCGFGIGFFLASLAWLFISPL